MEDLFGGTEIKQKGPIDTSLYGQLWTHGMKPGLGLPAPKMVIIQEWPVGLLLRVMQLGTILYLVFSAITQQQYLMFKVPTGAVFPMLSDGTLTQAQLLLAEQVRGRQPVHCHQPQMGEYSYSCDAERTFPITACFGMNRAELVSPDTNALFIKTMTRVQVEHTRPALAVPSTEAQCMDAFHAVGVYCNSTPVSGIGIEPHVEYRLWGSDGKVRPGQGSCWCRRDESTLTVDPLALQLELDHSFSSTQGSSEVRGVWPQTHVRLQDTLVDLAVFEAGDAPAASIAQWLKWAQVDLDQRINKPPNFQWLPDAIKAAGNGSGDDVLINSIQGQLGQPTGLWPYPRVTGLELKMTFTYYNYRRAPGVAFQWSVARLLQGARGSPAVCILYLKPVMGWQLRDQQPKSDNIFPLHLEEQTYYKAAGVLVSYQVEGEIAFFSMDVLLKVVTNSIVLLGLCGTVCVMICRYGLGTKSRFYSSILMEKVSVSRTYAQFAVRMIVASTFFDLIDDNASGEISKSEIFEKLRRLLQGKSTLEQTASLVEFMMEAADTGLEEEAMQTTTTEVAVKRGSAFDEDVEDEDAVVGTDDMDTVALQVAREPELVEAPREATINREEWVNIFVGPPCNVDSCVELIMRKNQQGRYLISDEDHVAYKRLDKKIRAEYKETQAAAERGDLETQVPLHLTKRKAARLFRRQKDELELFVKQANAARRDLQKVSKSLKALHALPAPASGSLSIHGDSQQAGRDCNTGGGWLDWMWSTGNTAALVRGGSRPSESGSDGGARRRRRRKGGSTSGSGPAVSDRL